MYRVVLSESAGIQWDCILACWALLCLVSKNVGSFALFSLVSSVLALFFTSAVLRAAVKEGVPVRDYWLFVARALSPEAGSSLIRLFIHIDYLVLYSRRRAVFFPVGIAMRLVRT